MRRASVAARACGAAAPARAATTALPALGATNEDDGYLMTYVYAGDTNTSYLVILDASNVAADPVAEIHIPQRVPTGFHGTWIND